MQTSANYNLLLFAGTDNVKRQDFVDNFTNIDSQMKIINDNSYPNVTATGTNAYVGSIDRIKSLGKGTKLTLFVGTDATGNCSLNLNSYGVKNIKDSFGNIVTNLKANIPYNICYNGTDFILQGKGGGGGTATASQILSGYTATTDTGQVTGTITSKVATAYNPSTSAQTITAGQYLSGVQTINPVTGTAAAAHVLSGYTFASANGIGLTGNIPNYANTSLTTTNHHSAMTVNVDPNDARMGIINMPNDIGPSAAYINNGSRIIAQLWGLIPSNIVAGAAIGQYPGYGSGYMTGTATVQSLGGRRFATGTTSSATNWNGQFQKISGEVTPANVNYITITGLSFKPSYIAYKASQDGYVWTTVYEEIPGNPYPKTIYLLGGGYSEWNSTTWYRGDTYGASVTNGAFTLPVANIPATWIAIE